MSSELAKITKMVTAKSQQFHRP